MQVKTIFGSIAGAALLHAILSACTVATTSPSREALAQNQQGGQGSVETSVEQCDKTFTDAEGRTTKYAEHAYPGKSQHELAGRVTNWVTRTQAADNFIGRPDWSTMNQQLVTYVRDGAVGAPCMGNQTETTFIYAP